MSAASETSDTLHADPPAATRTKRKRGQAAEAKARAAAAKLADQQQRGKFARQVSGCFVFTKAKTPIPFSPGNSDDCQ